MVKGIQRGGQQFFCHNWQKKWMSAADIGTMLGYARPRRAIHNIYDRQRKYFSGDDTRKELRSVGAGSQVVRTFSLSGALKIIRYARTKDADELYAKICDYVRENNQG